MMRSRIWMVLSGWRPMELKAASSNSCRSSLEMRMSLATLVLPRHLDGAIHRHHRRLDDVARVLHDDLVAGVELAVVGAEPDLHRLLGLVLDSEIVDARHRLGDDLVGLL